MLPVIDVKWMELEVNEKKAGHRIKLNFDSINGLPLVIDEPLIWILAFQDL